jgi:2-C-methyl-D-erythritol 4-phosphate cytidylyltransferase/2-C-methyl-D-erythritol 2,4-cyclodiphosphate synthase
VIGGLKVAGIVAAGGSGVRAGVAKQWLDLGGETALRRAARALAECPLVDEVVAVLPPGEVWRGRDELKGLPKPVKATAGGAARAESVRNGLDAATDAGIVLVHDAARPFATAALVEQVALAAARDGAALAAIPCQDTVKRAAQGMVVETVDRSQLWLAQTPQGFRTEVLRKAFEAAGSDAAVATDECSLVERLGYVVTLVPGEPGNFKITTEEDIVRAQSLAGGPMAIGVGYDVHPFAPGRRLVLGGIEFEGDGLAGHSDADICAHAIGDAILGAAGLGDLGRHFPDGDERFRGISSLALLVEIVKLAAGRGWRLGNCDVTLAAKRPRIAPRADEMRARLAEALGVAPTQVNLKATTGEELGFVGRGEGIAAHAVALLVRSRA